MSEDCDFGDKKEQIYQTKLAAGIGEKELPRQLHLMSDLTLETAVQMVRQAEDVVRHILSQTEQLAAFGAQEVTHRRPSKRVVGDSQLRREVTGGSTTTRGTTGAGDAGRRSVVPQANTQL